MSDIRFMIKILYLRRLEDEQMRHKLELLRERDPRKAESLLRAVGEDQFIR